MNSKIIKLSHQIRLRNKEDAKKFKLEADFLHCLKTLKNFCEIYDIDDSSKLTDRNISEIEKVITESYVSRFNYILKEVKPLTDVSGCFKFEINEIVLKLKAFNPSLDNLELDIFCISGELDLIETVGTFAIIKKNNHEMDWIKTLSIELSSDTTIYEIKIAETQMN